ncbi:MAG: hypothetical protein RLZZ603_943 [Actinomycetota bacterium]|jgi:xylulokinase
MTPDLVISIDCSTTGSKAIVWDALGNSVAEARSEMPLSIPQNGWGEQDPDVWWQATATAISEVTKKVEYARIGAIAITHQRESFVCLDEDGYPLRPGMLWLDTRAHEEVRDFGSREIHDLTGKPANPTPAFYKLMWMRRNEPELLSRAAKVVDVHSYLTYRLTGKFAAARASVDPLGLLNIETGEYSREILGMVGLDSSQLPAIFDSGAVIGEVSAAIAVQLGLPKGVKLVAGGGDGQCAGLGAGVAEPGAGYLNLGTGLIAGIYTDEYQPSMAYRVMAGTIADSFNCEFFVGAGTYLVNWFKNHQNLGDMNGKTPEVFWGERAAEVPIGSENLYTIPYWNGALTPYWDQQARGAIIGFTGIHGNEHLYRSILEGIAFELRLSMEAAVPTIGRAAERLIAMGGGARSPLWCQMMADVLRIPITISKAEEATSLGAAMLAFTAIGHYTDAKSASLKMSGFGITYEPDEVASEQYDQHFAIYRNLYPALKASFAEMAEM